MTASKRNFSASAALLGLIILAFVIGWFLPPTHPADGYDSRSVAPPQNAARLNDPAPGAP